MITLREAMNLTEIGNDELCYVNHYGDDESNAKIYTGKNVRDKYDMRRTMVVHIKPRFYNHFNEHKYQGIEFTIITKD